MVMKSYRSDFPNHVHQLVVSVSKHFYAGKDGLLKYQTKPMEMTLAKLSQATRKHMLTYVLRDHCSGVYYAETCFAPEVLPLKGFLARAWRQKPDYPFCGMPKLLLFPSVLREAFPGVAEDVESLGIELVKVTSGFQAGGTRDIRTIEEQLGGQLGYENWQHQSWSMEAAQAWIQEHNADIAKKTGRTGHETKLEMWQRGVGHLDFPTTAWWPDGSM